MGSEQTAAAAEAASGVERWASKLGVEIELVDSERSAREVVGVLAQVWPQANGVLPLNPELAWALAHSGNYVATVRGSSGPLAAAVAFRGMDEEGQHLHSHMVGVLPEHQGASIGYVLKQHQRAWALGHGLDRVTWTFDPLVIRNAYFNVMKLGARLTRYYVDFYGALTDGINAGDESDRCLVTWGLTDERTVAAAAGHVHDRDVAVLRSAGAVAVLSAGPDGQPVIGEAPPGRSRLVRVPADAVDLRRTDAPMGREWRRALRQVLVAAFDEGLEVTGVSRDGWYVIGGS